MTTRRTPPGDGVPQSLPDNADPSTTFHCRGPQCRCEHTPARPEAWCCEQCRDRHRDRKDRQRKPDTRDRSGRARKPDTRDRSGRQRQPDTRDRSGRTRKPDTRARSDRRRNPKQRRVAGVDGETIDNRYVLLVAATDDGEVWRVENPKGLTTAECFGFLTSLPHDVLYWGFAFRYDVNMMLGDVAPHLIERLQLEGTCYWGAYRIEYHGKRLLISKRQGTGNHRRVVANFTLWDMFPWVQTSFVKWLRKWELCGEQTIERIDKMKNLRSSFNPSQRPAIRKYCEQECRLMAVGARKLMHLIDVTELPVRAYNSPASVAKSAMTREHVSEYMAEPPVDCRRHVDSAYHGGRAELSVVGMVDGPFYAYDLNSAYPAMAVGLPCLAHGTWKHGVERFTLADCALGAQVSLLKVSWKERQGITWGPFPVNPKVGSKRYPTSGTGWYWDVEVRAAIKAGYHITVKDAWTFTPGCDHLPFSYLRDLYELRKQLQADNDESQIIYKLALNSTYGVLAEHPHKRLGEIQIPRYRNMMWAGLICAGVRAQLLDVLDDDVIFLATDCAVSRRPLQVPTGDELGAWGHDPAKDVFDRMLIFGTGQHFKSTGGVWSHEVKTRGFNPREIDREALTKLWETKGRAGVYTFKRSRFIGYGTALRRIGGMWPPMSRYWRTFYTETVQKRFDMTPRREWLTEDVMDGRTVAPSWTAHKATEKADAAELADWYRRYDEDRGRLERVRTLPNGKPNPFLHKHEARVWKDMLAITGMSGGEDHGRLFDQTAEPVAWGDDF